jgi:hypothetical protein
MARQTFYITREQRHPLYRTRMLQAGPIELNAGAAALFRKLGVEMSDEQPKAPKVEQVDAATDEPQRAPRKRATRRPKP